MRKYVEDIECAALSTLTYIGYSLAGLASEEETIVHAGSDIVDRAAGVARQEIDTILRLRQLLLFWCAINFYPSWWCPFCGIQKFLLLLRIVRIFQVYDLDLIIEVACLILISNFICSINPKCNSFFRRLRAGAASNIFAVKRGRCMS